MQYSWQWVAFRLFATVSTLFAMSRHIVCLKGLQHTSSIVGTTEPVPRICHEVFENKKFTDLMIFKRRGRCFVATFVVNKTT